MAGARGPKPEPAAIKIAKGNPGRRRVGADPVEIEEPVGGVRAPKTLTKEQREVWDQFAPDLERLKLLRTTDVAVFTRYCAYLAQWKAAERKTRTQALVTVTKSKHVTMERLNRHLQIMLLLDKRLTDIEDRFGMNPAARQRIFAQMAQGAGGGQTPTLPGLETPAAQAPPPTPAARGPVGILMN